MSDRLFDGLGGYFTLLDPSFLGVNDDGRATTTVAPVVQRIREHLRVNRQKQSLRLKGWMCFPRGKLGVKGDLATLAMETSSAI